MPFLRLCLLQRGEMLFVLDDFLATLFLVISDHSLGRDIVSLVDCGCQLKFRFRKVLIPIALGWFGRPNRVLLF